jgi:hypothetical protein
MGEAQVTEVTDAMIHAGVMYLQDIVEDATYADLIHNAKAIYCAMEAARSQEIGEVA